MSYGTNFHAPRVDVHQFAMIPRANIPRSQFRMQSQHKTTINASYLYPIYLQEVLPGDSFNVSMTAFVRLATPLFPIMDNLDLESFFFFVPNRLVWKHWFQFMGQEDTPGASISYTIPQIVSPTGGFAQFSIYDYMGLPCTGQTAGGNTISVSALPFRAYALIFSEWFRDENLVQPVFVGSAGTTAAVAGGVSLSGMDDGPDNQNLYTLQLCAKRHDYFTSCLPWTQKGTAGAVTLPLGSSAPVKTSAAWQRSDITALSGQSAVPVAWVAIGSGTNAGTISTTAAGNVLGASTTGSVTGGPGGGTTSINRFAESGTVASVSPASPNQFEFLPVNLYADLSVATAATINSIRLAFQTQKLLERDARGGTRYQEIVRSHFGVMGDDLRLMRPSYLGGGKQPITITPVPQTAQTGLTGGGASAFLGSLAAVGTGVMRHGFRGSFTEHGYILGLVTARADQVYQQGIRKLWSRSTRYDFYWPVFACLGEQAVLNKEIFSDGSANDPLTFGFNERWAEYRYHPSYTSGFFRSTNATPLDAWHLGIKFATLPTLNSAFINDPTTTILQRNLALAASSNNQQLLCDFFFDQRVARPMPMYSVPGLIDHF